MSELSARSWSSLLALEEFDVKIAYKRAVCAVAAEQAHERPDPEEGEEELEPPDISEPDILFDQVLAGEAPSWWPKRLNRIELKVRACPDDHHPEIHGPHTIDPNAQKLGIKIYAQLLSSYCDGIGTPFEGQLEIRLCDIRSRISLGGIKRRVNVSKKKKSKNGASDYGDAYTEYMTEQVAKKDAAMLQMFTQSSHVIHASAAAVNATRGVNMAPPWMNGEEGEDMPLWLRLAVEAGKIAFEGFGAGGANPGQAAGRMLQHQVPGPNQAYTPGYGPGYHQPRLLVNQGVASAIDPAGPPPAGNIYDQASQQGDYDGVYVDDDHIMDDGFDDPAFEIDEEDYEEEEIEYEEEEEEEEEENPFAGMSDEAVGAALEDWIDQHPDKSKLKGLGVNLAKKLF